MTKFGVVNPSRFILNGNFISRQLLFYCFSNCPDPPPQKSVCVTYLLWLVGGLFGAHHLYLGNDLHAFIWWTTLGGYFGMGWIGEAFRIPEMVREANQDPGYVERYVHMLRTTPKPSFSTSKFLFAIVVGYLYAQLFMAAIPQDAFFGIDWTYLHWLIPFVGALGKQSKRISFHFGIVF